MQTFTAAGTFAVFCAKRKRLWFHHGAISGFNMFQMNSEVSTYVNVFHYVSQSFHLVFQPAKKQGYDMDDDPCHNSQGTVDVLWIEEITAKRFHKKQC